MNSPTNFRQTVETVNLERWSSHTPINQGVNERCFESQIDTAFRRPSFSLPFTSLRPRVTRAADKGKKDERSNSSRDGTLVPVAQIVVCSGGKDAYDEHYSCSKFASDLMNSLVTTAARDER